MGTTNKRKFAVVTGASSGIGFELARQCVAHDCDVLICSDSEAISLAAEKLGGPNVAVAVRADLAKREGIQTLYREILDMRRAADFLLLNAGVGVGGPFLETDIEKEFEMIALNCNHTVHLAKLVIPDMVARGSGRVLITGSVVSTAPNPFSAVYGATKAFVMSFGEALRYELKDTGVTVTVLQPNATDTKFFERAHLEHTKEGQAEKDDPALVAEQGFAAMMDGKDSVLAGSISSRIEGFANELLPETTKAKLAGEASKPLRRT